MYNVGQTIADMHYGTPEKDLDNNPIKVRYAISIQLDNSDQLFWGILHTKKVEGYKIMSPYWKSHPDVTCLDNKLLKVIEIRRGNLFTNSEEQGEMYKAIWTYDDRRFGILEFHSLMEQQDDD